METTIMGYIRIILGLYWVYIGIMEKKMETTTMGYIGIIGYILGLYGFEKQTAFHGSEALTLYCSQVFRVDAGCSGYQLFSGQV